MTVEGADREQPINFTNEIVPLFSKLGCNSGACHGKSTGQNGFRLSLLGFEPQIDFEALTRESRVGAFFRRHPNSSLLLQKPAGLMPHGGGRDMENQALKSLAEAAGQKKVEPQKASDLRGERGGPSTVSTKRSDQRDPVRLRDPRSRVPAAITGRSPGRTTIINTRPGATAVGLAAPTEMATSTSASPASRDHTTNTVVSTSGAARSPKIRLSSRESATAFCRWRKRSTAGSDAAGYREARMCKSLESRGHLAARTGRSSKWTSL